MWPPTFWVSAARGLGLQLNSLCWGILVHATIWDLMGEVGNTPLCPKELWNQLRPLPGQKWLRVGKQLEEGRKLIPGHLFIARCWPFILGFNQYGGSSSYLHIWNRLSVLAGISNYCFWIHVSHNFSSSCPETEVGLFQLTSPSFCCWHSVLTIYTCLLELPESYNPVYFSS